MEICLPSFVEGNLSVTNCLFDSSAYLDGFIEPVDLFNWACVLVILGLIFVLIIKIIEMKKQREMK